MRKMRAGQWGQCWDRWEASLVMRRAPVRNAVEKPECPILLLLDHES
jgi:hypothetical protein